MVNGQTTTTGEAQMTIMQYNYTDPGMGRYGHQIDTSMYSGWGDAPKATIDGQGTLAGACTRNGATFPKKPLSPANSWQTGESFYDTTATAAGATGTCETFWYLTFTNAPYSPAVTSRSMKEVRCDNVTAGRPVVGCVVPWAASDLVYTRTATPELADHVAKAQASGLPSRLTRTENQTIIDSNRTRACGSAPSVPNKSCDEYPIASSHQGLNAGGTRRTQPGCGFTGVPAGTGPTGVSVCMIAAGDNNSQGGTNTQFFRRERVLENDPFNVVVR
ncbi:NucA/NucB deoxyribonuclease domain-containing protein [Streptomyces goshikiensis]|uniref:NucA/NucB deoxyribonuclease domain-containing protein n=1 Tax=Streptomyces goshikiensis TaxID=1942 RepID=UPI0037A3D2D0